MKRVNTFIRELNLKFIRKLRAIPLSEVGKRYVIDNNAAIFDAISEDTYGNQWGLSIEKWHGKYIINYWRNCWNDMDIIEEKVSITSDYKRVIAAINNAIGVDYECGGYDAFWFKDKHLNNLKWHVRNASELYDDEEEIDCGTLPENFEPVNEELESVPEEIAI